jgi:hypothetical protein
MRFLPGKLDKGTHSELVKGITAPLPERKDVAALTVLRLAGDGAGDGERTTAAWFLPASPERVFRAETGSTMERRTCWVRRP